MPHRIGPYRSIIKNDECVWEAYGIPMASLSRFPYPEYHSSHDNLSIIDGKSMDDAVRLLLASVRELESSKLVIRKFRGNLCLANPRWNLYIDAGQPAFGEKSSEQLRNIRSLMDLIPLIERPSSMGALSQRVGLPVDVVETYLHQCEQYDLIELR